MLDRERFASGEASPESVLQLRPDMLKVARVEWPDPDVSLLDDDDKRNPQTHKGYSSQGVSRTSLSGCSFMRAANQALERPRGLGFLLVSCPVNS